MKNILVPIDFSVAWGMLQIRCFIAKYFDADIAFIKVISPAVIIDSFTAIEGAKRNRRN